MARPLGVASFAAVLLVAGLAVRCGRLPSGGNGGFVWSFVDKDAATGLNQNATHWAGAPQLVNFNSKLYAVWPESTGGTSAPTRVAVFNGSDASPGWAFVDGNAGSGLYWNSGAESGEDNPRLIGFDSKLYAIWGERDVNNAIQVRVAVYNGNDAAPSWAFIDGNTSSGLNKSSARHAHAPSLGMFDGRLYATWSEENGTGAPQIRVVVYNGSDSAPSWSFVDGNGASTGINKDSTKPAGDPQLISFNSKLYAFWDEMDSTSQVRVAVYNGNDSSPGWTFVDGNGAVGINHDPSRDATSPWPAVFGNKIYAATDENNGTSGQVRVAVYNGNDTTPAWAYVDGNASAGLNYDPTRKAQSTQSLAVVGSQLVAMWTEGLGNSIPFQIRAAQYNGNDLSPAWSFIDGGGGTGINYSATATALSPSMAVLGSQLYGSWYEGTPGQIRVATFRQTSGGN